jgi:hypothetical protein
VRFEKCSIEHLREKRELMRIRSLAVATLIVAAPLLGPTPVAAADTYYYQTKLINVTSSSNQILTGLGRVGSCRNPGGKCTINVTVSRSTSVQTALGVSASWISAQLSFSLSQSSAVGISASSPRNLTSSEEFRAYATGVIKHYKIQKSLCSRYGCAVTDTSGTLTAMQPYASGASIAFGIYGI